MKTLVLTIAIMTLAAGQVSAAEKKEAASAKKEAVASGTSDTSGGADTTCTNKGSERKISLIKEGTGCKIDYTKEGETKTIVTQKNGVDFCESKVDQIKSKLVAAGYDCK